MSWTRRVEEQKQREPEFPHRERLRCKDKHPKRNSHSITSAKTNGTESHKSPPRQKRKDSTISWNVGKVLEEQVFRKRNLLLKP